MPEYKINGITVNFPFEPYDVQKAYMEKVIDCLNNGTNGILESPTGTGKTLSLLCSTLAWITTQKLQQKSSSLQQQQDIKNLNNFSNLSNTKNNVPKVIYSSRTHSQLGQAINELKRTSYSHMRTIILGSRDQLCIHPDVSKEQSNSIKIHMCKLRITTRSCSFYNNVERQKDILTSCNQNVLDIEDLIQIGRKVKACPYFLSKESIDTTDMIFMPYNYLLDPKARKAHNINLENTIIILDEAHNVEKICEESASTQIKSSDIALSIDDITQVMKLLNENGLNHDEGDVDDGEKRDFTIEDLIELKEKLLNFEKLIDDIKILNETEGMTYPAKFVHDLFHQANITEENCAGIMKLIENIIQYVLVADSNNTAFRKNVGLERLLDFLIIVFSSNNVKSKDKIFNSFKVHIEIEENKKNQQQQNSSFKKDNWITSKSTSTTANKKDAKIINYWCFNPGFSMKELLDKNVRSIILTSGTLAPLKPLVTELSIPISNYLENPHIIDKSQVCVKIVPFGPDREILNSSFKNRNNPKYITSLGRTISSFCPIIPGGLLVFFPSYPLLYKCQDNWQASGIWSQINKYKKIYVEPRDKNTFNTTMSEYYDSINDKTKNGACFMAVCRGKVSEGLDFADINGRAVIITGLPYPPLKDPRIVLKRQYLDENRNVEGNELISGEHWYGLEASRAVNQAIGRVIRHKNDYGAILLCDARFKSISQKSQLSSWIQDHLKASQDYTIYGPFIGEISKFFKNAEKLLPIINKNSAYRTNNLNSSLIINESQNVNTSQYIKTNNIEKSNNVNIWKSSNSKNDEPSTSFKRNLECVLDSGANAVRTGKKLRMIMNSSVTNDTTSSGTISTQLTEYHSQQSNTDGDDDDDLTKSTMELSRPELLKLIKNSLPSDLYAVFLKGVMNYRKNSNIDEFMKILLDVFNHPTLYYLLKIMCRFVKGIHKVQFNNYIKKNTHKN